MKANSILLMGLASLIGLSSCNDERIINQSTTVNAIMVTGEDFADGETGTRATYLVDGTGFHFTWSQGDTVGIYPVGGDQVAFPISSGEGSQTAQFDGGAWALRSSYSYAAYYPFSSDNYKAKENAIPVSFLGLVQNGNGSLSGLDRYDYQAAVATKPDANGNVNIALKHLACFVRFQLTMPVADTYKSIELKSNKTPFITTGTIDLTSDTICITPISTSQTISIDLNNTSTTTEDSVLVVYAMLAPSDMSGNIINVIVTGTDDKKYVSFVPGKKMIAGKAYSFKAGTTDDVVIADDGEIVPPDNEIWYITNDNTIIDLEASYSMYCSKPFDANVISHTYENGRGVIKCDGPIKIINGFVFGSDMFTNINSLFLPNSIHTIGGGAINGISASELRVPDSLEFVDYYGINIPTLERFRGKNVSDDGRCIVVNGVIMAYAPKGIVNYTTPLGAKAINGYVFMRCNELENIIISDGIEELGVDLFSSCENLRTITLPKSLKTLWSYMVHHCPNIEGFYGNPEFITDDHKCLIRKEPFYGNIITLDYFAGKGVLEYAIPEGIESIECDAFISAKELTTLTIPSSLKFVRPEAFRFCDNIETLIGEECVSTDKKGIAIGDKYYCLVAKKGVTTYFVPEGIKAIASEAFSECPELQEIIVNDDVEYIHSYAFAFNSNLKKVVLPKNLKGIQGDNSCDWGYNPFFEDYNLEEIYFRSYIPPVYVDTQFNLSDCSNLTIYVPEETLELYKKSGWSQYAPYMVGYKYDDIGEWNPDYYMSTDMSNDGEVTTLQQSTIGDGIDLILMGDAFSDRQITNGTYDDVMQGAMDAFFSEEPFKSFKNTFNVYSVNVVSMTEGYEHGGQALGTGFGYATYVYGNDDKVIEYAKKAISEDRLDDAVIIVMMNEDAYAGTCFMYDALDGNFGRGLSIAYFPVNSIPENFNGLVLHEAGGHGFAKLADEYAYEENGTIDHETLDATRSKEQYGWWKNIDFTSDPTQVKWSQFISDSRYVNENIGCYEGGLTYWSGVWRPTENSIMRYNTGGFNAPSRYAIWYRINKLAYGESWNGTYEDFVEYDAINRASSGAPRRTEGRRNYVEKPLPALAPPVVVGHSWREAK